MFEILQSTQNHLLLMEFFLLQLPDLLQDELQVVPDISAWSGSIITVGADGGGLGTRCGLLLQHVAKQLLICVQNATHEQQLCLEDKNRLDQIHDHLNCFKANSTDGLCMFIITQM